MPALRTIKRSFNILYPERDEDQIGVELRDALARIYKKPLDDPHFEIFSHHVREALSYGVDVAQKRGGSIFNKKHYADPLTIVKKLASLSDTQTARLFDDETVLAAILYPFFHVRRSEGNFDAQYQTINHLLKNLYDVFSLAKNPEDEKKKREQLKSISPGAKQAAEGTATPATNKALGRNVKNLIIEILELSEINHRIKTSPINAVSSTEEIENQIREFHKFAYIVAERAKVNKNEMPRALMVRLVQRLVRTDYEIGRRSKTDMEAYNRETQEVYVNLAASYPAIIAIQKALQRQLQLMTDSKIFASACKIVQKIKSVAAEVTGKTRSKANHRPEEMETYILDYLENMFREIIPAGYSFRMQRRAKDEESTFRKIIKRKTMELGDLLALRIIVSVKPGQKKVGNITEAECALSNAILGSVRAVTQNPDNPYGLSEQRGDFDNFFSGNREHETAARQRGYRALHSTFEVSAFIDRERVSFAFETQFTGEETHARNNQGNAVHSTYKGLHPVDLAQATNTTTVLVNNMGTVQLPRGARIMDYAVAAFGPDAALTINSAAIKPARNYSKLSDAKGDKTEEAVLMTVPKTADELLFRFEPSLVYDQGRMEMFIKICSKRQSKMALQEAIGRLRNSGRLPKRSAHTIRASSHHHVQRPSVFELPLSQKTQFPRLDII